MTTTAAPAPAHPIERAQAHDVYYTMRLIRRFEERIVGLVNANEIAGVTHEYIGQEAVATGMCAALGRDDILTSTHRGHGHLLARGADPARMMAELFSRTTGLNRARGGSMHIADFSLGIYGANGIVAAGAPIAAGGVWAARQKGRDSVGVTFFGDGAINQGVLHETMNLAAIWSLPLIFCCENNGYAVTMPITRASSAPIAERVSGYGFPVHVVDGMDPQAVYDAAAEAVAHGRAGGGPSFIECQTYRFRGHHTAEATQGLIYRTDDEIQTWQVRDPISTWPQRLIADDRMTEGDRDEIDARVEQVLDDAVEFARNSPLAQPEEALDHMYAGYCPPGFPRKGWSDV
jgi:pyruvate dehydrogenase E1 component alpha subunit